MQMVGEITWIQDDLMKVIPPDGKWASKHTFCKILHGDLEYWVDLTVTRKLRGMDSAKLYRLEDSRLIFDRYVRVDIVRKEGAV